MCVCVCLEGGGTVKPTWSCTWKVILHTSPFVVDSRTGSDLAGTEVRDRTDAVKVRVVPLSYLDSFILHLTEIHR